MPRAVKCPQCAHPVYVAELLSGETGESSTTCPDCGLRILYDYSGSEPEYVERSLRYAARLKISGYRLLGVLPAGGMGYIYSAERESNRQLVAIKVLPPDFAAHPSLVARFRREAHVMKGVRHPNIMSVIEEREEDPRAIVMPFVAGRTLHAAQAELRVLRPEEAAAVFAPLAEALEHMHQCGYIHRDVKPSNVFLTERGEVVLFDFGIARPIEVTTVLTDPGVAVGTPAYNAPELYERRQATAQSDQFSLAVLLYEMLTGYLPMGVFRPPRDLCHDLPEMSSDSIMRALSHDPGDRFESVRKFARSFFRPLTTLTPAENFRDTVCRLSHLHPSLFEAAPNLTPLLNERGRPSAIGSLLSRLSFSGGSKTP